MLNGAAVASRKPSASGQVAQEMIVATGCSPIVVPSAKMAQPRAIVYLRLILSETRPARMPVIADGNKIIDTTSPANGLRSALGPVVDSAGVGT
jgi:hypothetical protein